MDPAMFQNNLSSTGLVNPTGNSACCVPAGGCHEGRVFLNRLQYFGGGHFCHEPFAFCHNAGYLLDHPFTTLSYKLVKGLVLRSADEEVRIFL